jgi:hypothetical protein
MAYLVRKTLLKYRIIEYDRQYCQIHIRWNIRSWKMSGVDFFGDPNVSFSA